MKLIFLPVSIISGLIAGFISKKLFEALWGVVDDEEPPDSKHRDIVFGKLAIALLLEGAIVRFVRGAVDHVSRHGFERLTGAWPGEEEPEPE